MVGAKTIRKKCENKVPLQAHTLTLTPNLTPNLIAGIYGVPICNRDVTESNKRGAAHIHGQHHGGMTPALLADLAGYPELLELALAALDTQLQAEMPLEYHLVDIARHTLRIGVRRDAAADIPRPDARYLQTTVPDAPDEFVTRNINEVVLEWHLGL